VTDDETTEARLSRAGRVNNGADFGSRKAGTGSPRQDYAGINIRHSAA